MRIEVLHTKNIILLVGQTSWAKLSSQLFSLLGTWTLMKALIHRLIYIRVGQNIHVHIGNNWMKNLPRPVKLD